MFDVDALLDAAKARAGITSDYRLCKVAGISDTTMYNYRHGLSFPDDQKTFKLCEMAGLNPAPYLLEIHAERAKTEEIKQVWNTLITTLKRSGIVAM